MLLFIYRFLAGWLTVEFRGHQVMRLMNLCVRHQIPLWNVHMLDDTIQACMMLRDVRKLRSSLRKTHVHFRICQRRGLPFLLHRYRTHRVLFLTVPVVTGGIIFLSMHIWRIDFIGNSSISEETLLHYLARHEITYGTYRGAIDNDALELSLRQDFEPVIWASVYEDGTRLVVCIQEKIASDRQTSADTMEPADLIASKDAVIQSVVTRKGIAAVQKGDVVQKGALLVNGRQEILDDNGEVKQYFYECADADVIGRVTYSYEDWIAVEEEEKVMTGKVHRRYYVRIRGCQITSPMLHAAFNDADLVEDNRQLCLMDSFYLPVYYGTISEYEMERSEHKLDFDEAKSLAIQHFEHFLAKLEQNGVSIVGKNVMMEKIDLKYHVYGQITADESITMQHATEVLPDPVPDSEDPAEEQ